MFASDLPSDLKIRVAFMATALGGLLFTFDLPLLRLSMADQWTMIALRGLLLFATITAAWLMMPARGEGTPYVAGLAGLAVAFFSGVGNMSYIGAVAHTNAANVVFLIALTPVIAAAVSRLLLGEQVHSYTWAATSAAFLGASVIASAGLHGGNCLGDSLALLSAFCSAAILTMIRATGRNVTTSVARGSLPVALARTADVQSDAGGGLRGGPFGMPALFWLGLNGLVTMPLATALLARGPRMLPSADVGLFFMLETILTPV